MSAFDRAVAHANAAHLRVFGDPVTVLVGDVETNLVAIRTDEMAPEGGWLPLSDSGQSFHFDALAFGATGAGHGHLLRMATSTYRIIDTQADGAGMVRVTVSPAGVNVPS